MKEEKKSRKESAYDNFADMFKQFGSALGEIFNDPKLQEKAKEFGKSALDAARTFASRFEDEEVKEKFREVGKAAQNFGKSLADRFKDEKDREDSNNKKR